MANDKKNQTKNKSSSPKSKGGRPSKFRPEYVEHAKKLCLLGAIDKDIADFFNVTEKTIDNWKKQHPEFLQSLKKAKQVADAKVVRSLYERATGYEHDDLFITQYQGKIVKEVINKKYPPEVAACIFWLKNRDPENWKDKQEIDHNIPGVAFYLAKKKPVENGTS